MQTLPQLDPTTFPSQLFWLLVTFAALYLVLAHYVLPRIHDVLEKRRNRMEDDLNRAENYRREAQAAQDAYQRSLQTSRTEAQAIIASAQRTATQQAMHRQQELDTSLSGRLAQAEQRIQAATAQAMVAVGPLATALAGQIAEKILQTAVDPARVAATVERLTTTPKE